MLGLRTFFSTPANVTFTTNVALATIGLTSPIAANQKQNFKAWIFFLLGATGGFKTEVVVPAGGSVYNVQITIFDGLTPAVDTETITAAASYGKALANAGKYYAQISGYIKNGATAGTIDIQCAQNSSDANTLTVYEGSFMDVITF